jgi:hypothetical protein
MQRTLPYPFFLERILSAQYLTLVTLLNKILRDTLCLRVSVVKNMLNHKGTELNAKDLTSFLFLKQNFISSILKPRYPYLTKILRDTLCLCVSVVKNMLNHRGTELSAKNLTSFHFS